jgi:hypothetical protein
MRKFWGDGTIFKGSALTFGGVVYHGDAPFQRYTLTDETSGPDFLTAPRGTTSDLVPLDQSRTSNYQSIFFEDLIRIGKFHMVGSFRLDHEDVEVDSAAAPWLATVPPTGPASISADHWVPLWGFGMVTISVTATKLISVRLRGGGRHGSSILLEPAAQSPSVNRYRTRSIRWTSN